LTVKWHGKELLEAIRESAPDGLLAGAQLLVDSAASRAPRASGDLANSGYVANENKSTYKHDKKHNKEVKPPRGAAVAGFAVFYAKFIELGTKNHPARPFLRPAFDELKEQIGSEIVMKMGKRFR
jgi:HK97 gp10 family phage protein